MEQERIDYYQLANIYLNKAQNCCQLHQHTEGLSPLVSFLYLNKPPHNWNGDINRITDDGNTEPHQKYKHKWHSGQLSCQNYNRNNQKLPQVKYRRSILSSSIHPPYYQQYISTILFLMKICCIGLCIISKWQSSMSTSYATPNKETPQYSLQVDFVKLGREEIPHVCQSPVKQSDQGKTSMLLLLDMISTNVIATFLILTRIITIGKIWLISNLNDLHVSNI